MSTIAGCWWRHGRPAAEADLQPAMQAASHRSRHPVRTWTSGSVALACAAPDADLPLHDSVRGLTLVLDGRIHNHDEIASALAVERVCSAGTLILRAYERWGIEAAARLIGDFAFAIWDARTARLVCARDAMGQRPLFYADVADGVVFACEPQQVLRFAGVSRGIDEGAVAEQLTGFPMSVEGTPWRDVRRLPPAHALVAGADGVRIVRHWDYDPSMRVRARRPDDYASQLRALFVGAVRCRLDDAASAGVFLSGGVDSSSVAGVAAALARDGHAPPIHALSNVFPGEACDESPYINAVVEHCRLPSECRTAEGATREAIVTEIDRYCDLPQYPNGFVLDPLRRRAAALGLPVVLTGYGGDDWLAGAPLHPGDVLYAGHPWEAARQVVRRAGRAPRRLARGMAGALLPPRLRRAMRGEGGGVPPAPWIRPAFAARVALRDRLAPRPVPPFRSAAQRAIYRAVTSAIQVLGDEFEDRAAHAAGIEQRHPFYDRRLAAFGLALPDDQRWRDGRTKIALRRAMADVLPPVVAARRTKAEFSGTFMEALAALGGHDAFTRLRTEEAGWIDAGLVRRRYDEAARLYSQRDPAYIALTDGLWEIAVVELWMERMGL